MGLSNLDSAATYLLIGGVLFVIGWIISQSSKQENGERGSAFGGCLIAIGICFALPALAWVHTIGTAIYTLFVVIIIVAVIFNLLTKR